MPRKPKAGRQFQKNGSRSVADAVRERFANPFTMLMLEAETFHTELPTREERLAFCEVFPGKFLGILRFFEGAFRPEPADVEYGFDVFQRPPAFFEEHLEAVSRFDPPDLRTVTRGDFGAGWLAALGVARGQWFQENGLQITPREAAWLRRREASKSAAAPSFEPEISQSSIIPMERRDK